MTDEKEKVPEQLRLLQRYTINNLTPQLLDKEYNVVSKLQDATYIKFDSDSSPLDINMEIIFQGSSFPLSIFYHATITKELSYSDYNQAATEEKLSKRLNFSVRKSWVGYVTGTLPLSNDSDKTSGKTSEKRRHDNSADSDHKNAAEIKRQKKARFDSDKIWMENYQKEYQATSNWPWEEALESKDKEENYSQYINHADHYVLKTKGRDSITQERPGHPRLSDPYAKANYRPEVRQSLKPPQNPLIVVPSAPSAFINMLNIRQLLQDAKYENSNDLHYVQKKSHHITINRNGKDYEFTDLVDDFKPSDWNRVVCVITDGSEWLFRKYKWQTPQETFNHVPGVYFKFTHEEAKKNVVVWRNVYLINIHRELRHKDSEAYTEFWNIVEGKRT
ncbi:43987_t:CDS:2 [Gigaspora margarita]|uniref:43987_t:CDS:1 n=2 Tax=Gigaspora margarita TaxID=4874 RepID=A0ABN7V5K6_GIGMA|nr:CDC73-domain-containing protein [Gigaspora margarita]CAG8727937.1 43987_t:CDS:2 [Gigaspora margarita]